jgi:hypothetical protein
MRRKGRHWITQQLRRALAEVALKPEAELGWRIFDETRANFGAYELADDSAAGLPPFPFPPGRREGGDQRPAAG